jgi:uncharacterized membrane protein
VIRDVVSPRRPGDDPDFRVRGVQPGRLENFSDAIFGLALTLLTVSLEVPRSYAELTDTLMAFPGFAFTFVALFALWQQHVRFFRRYDLNDGVTIALNGVLLFAVLFYVFPLKFAMNIAFGSGSEGVGRDGREMVIALCLAGAGVVSLVFAALHARAYQLRATLDLAAREAALTRLESLKGCAAGAVVIGCAVAAVAVPRFALVGFVAVVPLAVMSRRARARIRRDLPAT